MNQLKPMSSQERIEFWKNEIDAYHKSGKSPQAFCVERGIGVSSLSNWRRKLGKDEESEVENETVSIPVVKPRSKVQSATLRIELNGIAFELSGGMDPGWVASLLMRLQGGKGTC